MTKQVSLPGGIERASVAERLDTLYLIGNMTRAELFCDTFASERKSEAAE